MGAVKTDAPDNQTDLNAYLDAHQSRIVKLADGRLKTPAQPQHMEMHNEWCANVDGSTLIIPVSDLAQHALLNLCYLVQRAALVFMTTSMTGPFPALRNLNTGLISKTHTRSPIPTRLASLK